MTQMRDGRRPLRSSTAPITVPSVKLIDAGPSHGSISEAWYCVERPARRVHRLVALPGLGNHHQHGVRQAAATEMQQLEHLVEARGVRGAGRTDRNDLVEILIDRRRRC